MEPITRPRLVYFASRGRAEAIRLLLCETQTDYEEISVGEYHPTEKSESFKKIKETGLLTFDALPLWIEPDGFSLVQSNAILRYLARSKGLCGKNVQESARCDMLMDGINDMREKVVVTLRAASTQRDEAKNDLINKEIPWWLRKFESVLKNNNEGVAYFVGDSLTYADLVMWLILESYDDNKLLDLTKFPLLKAFKERVENRPNIAAYRKNPKRFPIQWIFGPPSAQ